MFALFCCSIYFFFFFKQKTAYEMRISDWSSDVCSSDLDYGKQQYLKSSDEMAALVDDVPDAIDNALALAQRCNLELRLGTYYLPAFPVPSDHTLDSWIRSEARDGLARRLETQPLAEGHDRDSYAARLETELGVIIKMR